MTRSPAIRRRVLDAFRFAFANCGLTSTTDPRFASCNFIPQNRMNPIAAAMLSKLVLPTQPGYTNNYFVTNGYDTNYHKIDAKLTLSNPGPRLNLNGRLGFLPSWERSLGILPALDGSAINPLSQGRETESFVNSHSIGATSVLVAEFRRRRLCSASRSTMFTCFRR